MPLPHKGPVEALANNIAQAEKRNYFKWTLANHLANITLKILDQRTQYLDDNHSPLDGLKQSAPPGVRKYLETGLQSSFMDYRGKRKWFKNQKNSQLDINLNQVIACIESEMEIEK